MTDIFDPEECVGLKAFGFTIEPDGATAALSPREVTVETTGCMEVIITHPNGDHLFMGCHTLIGTVAGIEHRGDIWNADERAAEEDAGLIELGFVEIDDVYGGYRWAGTVAVQIDKKDSCSFDVHITFPNGDRLYIACDFLCGHIGGVEWTDTVQRDECGLDPSPLLANCA